MKKTLFISFLTPFVVVLVLGLVGMLLTALILLSPLLFLMWFFHSRNDRLLKKYRTFYFENRVSVGR